jgi:DNA invertase Pin-like site-specific DNA recombinase
MRCIAYYRVSTDRQGRSGLGLEAQSAAVRAYVSHRTGDLVECFTEIESGRRVDRPQLAAAIASCRQHKATLLIAKLDRLARNVHFISGLMESGVDFIACDMPQANRLTVHIMAAMAEHEREMISTRTREAMTAAKARGQRLGAPDPAAAWPLALAAQAAQREARDARSLQLISLVQSGQTMSFSETARRLNALGIASPCGGRWHPASVRAILRRCDDAGT